MSLEKEPSIATDKSRSNKKRILIVDDDETILHILRRFFIGQGFEVFVARDGSEAQEKLRTETPAVVLTDIKMGVLSGIDLIRFIRLYRKGMPIIAMSAYPHLFPEKRNGDEVEACFTKPFDVDEMISTIERILGV